MICKYAKEHPAVFLFAVILLFLPVIAAIIQASSFPKFIPMGVGECVGYYGTAGTVIWAICAFVVQKNDHEEELELEYKPSLELVINDSDEIGSLEMRLINAGLHGVRSVQFGKSTIAPYIASEGEVCFKLLADPEKRTLRMDREVRGGLLQNFAYGMTFCEGLYPSELCMVANDLRGKKWLMPFQFERQGAFKGYIALEAENYDDAGSSDICGIGE